MMSFFMGALGGALGQRTITNPGTPPPPVGGTILERIDAISGGPEYHWRLADATSASMAARVGGVAGSWVNATDLKFGIDPLTTDAASGKSVGFGGASSNPGHAEVTIGGAGITIASQHTISHRVQLDLHKSKHIILSTGDTGVAGQFSREFITDGAGGLKPRAFTLNASGVAVIYVGTAPGTVPIGTSFGVDWIQEDGALRVRINGVNIAMSLNSGTPPASWAAAPAGTLHIGQWSNGSQPLDGLMSELAIWNSYVFSLADSTLLNIPQNVVWLSNFDAGSTPINQTADILLAPNANPSSGFSVSIQSQGSLGAATVSGEEINYAAAGTAGNNDTFTARITKSSITSRTATITIDVTGTPPASSNVPFLGRFYGGGAQWGTIVGNTRVRGVLTHFFYAQRTGTVTQFRYNRRTGGVQNGSGYSGGTGGTYTIQILPASSSTKRETGAAAICSLTGHNPGNPGDASFNAAFAFTTTGSLTAGQPYVMRFTNTHASPISNFFSVNNNWAWHHNNGIPEPAPTGTSPNSVGASPVAVSGWSPVWINGQEWYPLPTTWESTATGDGWRYHGTLLFDLLYSDGVWAGGGFQGTSPLESGAVHPIGGADMIRMRFTVSRATRVVNGVFIYGARFNATTGNMFVTLENGPASTTSGNGSQIEQRSASGTLLHDVGTNWIVDPDKANWVWFPFTANRTLTLGQTYSLRVSADTALDMRMWLNRSAANNFSGSREWTQWEDADTENITGGDGPQKSSNSGSTWAQCKDNNGVDYGQAGILFRCV